MPRLMVDVVRWGDTGAAGAVRSAIASSRAILIEGIVDGGTCSAIARAVREDPPTVLLTPLRGENTVSNARNVWTKRAYLPSRLLIEGARRRRKIGQARLDLEPCFEPQSCMPSGLLGGHALNARDSCIFVTSQGLRTGLHSDERHGVLLHVSGAKSFVLIPPEDSDADPAALAQLLQLRGTPGDHETLYGDPPHGSVPALRRVRRFQGSLRPGDGLFIPQRWLHDIESKTATISASLRFGNWDAPNDPKFGIQQ